MIIRLLTQQGPHKPGSLHEVKSVVPHGGYTDSEKQYVIEGGTYVPSDCATIVKD